MRVKTILDWEIIWLYLYNIILDGAGYRDGTVPGRVAHGNQNFFAGIQSIATCSHRVAISWEGNVIYGGQLLVIYRPKVATRTFGTVSKEAVYCAGKQGVVCVAGNTSNCDVLSGRWNSSCHVVHGMECIRISSNYCLVVNRCALGEYRVHSKIECDQFFHN